jgi:hypothetical protein
MAEAAAQEGALPICQNSQLRHSARAARCRQEGAAELLGQVHQDGAGLEHPHRLRPAAVQQRRDLGVGVDLHEAAAELLALVDADQPGVVLGARMAQGQQFLQHHGHLDAVGRAQRVELQRWRPTGSALMRGAGDGAVDAGEAPPLVGSQVQTRGGW